MRKLYFLLFISLSSMGLIARELSENDLLEAVYSISSHEIMDYLTEVYDDKYAGRRTGTEEYKEVAEWLAGFFEEIGLQAGGDDKSWYQWFDIPHTLIHPDCAV